MKKKEIIKKNYEFSKIINKRQIIKNKYFTVFYQENKENNKYGISIPKKIGNAVIRNKIKRQIKNIIDINKLIIPNSYDYVIIIKESVLEIHYQELQSQLINLLKKVKGEQNAN